MRISLEEFKKNLPLPANSKWPKGVWDIEVFRKNELSVLLFSPKQTDYQTSHDQDELYFVQNGKGVLTIDGKHFEFGTADILFVRSGQEHQFISFSNDLILWVILFGERSPI